MGNWSGVTVEKKTASMEYEGKTVNLVDLPGTYSLSPYNEEELVARDYLIHGKPDVIINVIDATNLERNLYLTVQLLELGIPMVVALNMYDEATRKGYAIDAVAMGEKLGAAIIPTVATKRKGLDELMKASLDAAGVPDSERPGGLAYGEEIESAIGEMEKQIGPDLAVESYPARWLALKLMEGDERVYEELSLHERGLAGGEALARLREAHGPDMESLMADARYGQAAGLTREVLKKTETGERGGDGTDRWDSPPPVLWHPHIPRSHVACVQIDL